jgi:hypothetical protein
MTKDEARKELIDAIMERFSYAIATLALILIWAAIFFGLLWYGVCLHGGGF